MAQLSPSLFKLYNAQVIFSVLHIENSKELLQELAKRNADLESNMIQIEGTRYTIYLSIFIHTVQKVSNIYTAATQVTTAVLGAIGQP